MLTELTKKVLSVVTSIALVAASSQLLYGNQSQSSAPPTVTGDPTEAAPSSAAELESLVAPIALYPDSLVAQVLTASTFPDQVAIADYWLVQNKSLTASALMQAVDKQSWDPSVKALTEFPSVLENMAKNLSWTSSLGEAYHSQQADVMTAIQTLRAKAKTAGNLKTTSQVTVVQQSPQVIVIQPTNPQVVYVPVYSPAVVYGYPYVVPAYTYTPGAVVAAGIIGFGAGIAVGAMMSGGCCSWGYSSWNCGWHGTAVIYHGGGYYGNSAWHGGYYNGGYHDSYGYNNNYNHNNYNHSNYNNNYAHSGNTYNKNVSGNTVNVSKQGAQNFNDSHSSASNSWAQHSSGSGAHSDAFSGMSGHSGGFGDSGGGGWSSRADSGRGWGSMRSSGFSGGRFGGGGGGFGGGGFRR
ncbi:MAG: DUF3300 domain-containing protein [Candidatus Acidiferrales bacterium]